MLCMIGRVRGKNVVLWLKRTLTKGLQIELVTKIWYKRYFKGKFGGGVQICEGGSISASGFGLGGSKSAVTPASSRRQEMLMILQIYKFTNCPTHRSNLGVGWSRGSNSRCRVKSIPKADMGIGKRVSQIILEMSGKSVQSGFGK